MKFKNDLSFLPLLTIPSILRHCYCFSSGLLIICYYSKLLNGLPSTHLLHPFSILQIATSMIFLNTNLIISLPC